MHPEYSVCFLTVVINRTCMTCFYMSTAATATARNVVVML